jgi:hypothetical protein
MGTYGSGLTTGGKESSNGFNTKAILTCSLKGIWFWGQWSAMKLE